MTSGIFLKCFKIGILINLLLLVGVPCPSPWKSVKDRVSKAFGLGIDYERLVKLFANEQYRQLKCPEVLRNLKFGPKTAKDLFDELLLVFIFAKAEMPLTIPVNMNRYKVNVNKTQDETVKKLVQDVIEKVLKNEDPAVKEGPEIIGEAALRVGADLIRAFYFVIGADYKRVQDLSPPDIEKEFPEDVGAIKDTLTHAEKSKRIDKARIKILDKKVEHFQTMWEKVDSIEKTIYLEKNRVYVQAERKYVSNKLPKVVEKQDEKDRKAQEKAATNSRMKY